MDLWTGCSCRIEEEEEEEVALSVDVDGILDRPRYRCILIGRSAKQVKGMIEKMENDDLHQTIMIVLAKIEA